MAYPPPPGVTNPANVSSTPSHPSLPARPPPGRSSGGFKPAFSSTGPSAPPAYSSAPSYGPSPAASHGASSYSSYAAPPSMSAAGYQAQPQSYQYPQASAGGYQSNNYGATATPNTYGAPPQIRNPFPMPGAAGGDYDPEMAAQIAQWQSAYVTRDPAAKDSTANNNAKPGAQAGTLPSDNKPLAPGPEEPAVGEKKKTVVREGGGKKWTDDTLVEWDPAHLRLFVGNLAGEVTDESLLKAFSRWKSVQRARVIRDKRTTKSKGYGFVSFSDPDDFFQAAKEMNGKYIQSHPVIVSKAKTEIKVTSAKEKDRGKNWNKKKQHHSGSGQSHDGGYEPQLGPVNSSGVTKPGQKTKNGLKLLG